MPGRERMPGRMDAAPTGHKSFNERYETDAVFRETFDAARDALIQFTEARLNWDSPVMYRPEQGTLGETMRVGGKEMTGRLALLHFIETGEDSALRAFVEGNDTMHTEEYWEEDGTPTPATPSLRDALTTFFSSTKIDAPDWLNEASS